MNVTTAEYVWLNDHALCTAQHLIDVSGLSAAELDELIANDVIVAVDQHAPVKSFPLHHVMTATRARRLRDDFELDLHGVALALTLLQRIETLQAELRAARARIEESR